MNIEPYGLPGAHAVDRLEEALQIIRRCFTSQGPIDFAGEHFRLEGAVMDLQPPPAGHRKSGSPRMGRGCSG